MCVCINVCMYMCMCLNVISLIGLQNVNYNSYNKYIIIIYLVLL